MVGKAGSKADPHLNLASPFSNNVDVGKLFNLIDSIQTGVKEDNKIYPQRLVARTK